MHNRTNLLCLDAFRMESHSSEEEKKKRVENSILTVFLSDFFGHLFFTAKGITLITQTLNYFPRAHPRTSVSYKSLAEKLPHKTPGLRVTEWEREKP